MSRAAPGKGRPTAGAVALGAAVAAANGASFVAPGPLRTAVLLLVFNRPDTTARVFDAIRQVRPPRLYVAGDGPRAGRADDVDRVRQARAIATQVDWPCELKTLFGETNLGCAEAPARGVTWFFEQEEMGIVLEDDCLPSQSFFWYCEELLERYRDDDRVFLVSGYNRRNRWRPEAFDYFFSNLGGIWGWASWRRAWKHFDLDMAGLDEFVRGNCFEYLLGERIGRRRQHDLVQAQRQRPRTAWSYPWGFARHRNGALSCVPSRSLIENIGFGADATHTTGGAAPDVTRHELRFPMRENPFFVPDRRYDECFFEAESRLGALRQALQRAWRRFAS